MCGFFSLGGRGEGEDRVCVLVFKEYLIQTLSLFSCGGDRG